MPPAILHRLLFLSGLPLLKVLWRCFSLIRPFYFLVDDDNDEEEGGSGADAGGMRCALAIIGNPSCN